MNERFDILTDLGEYTGKTATPDECHSRGYWHRAVFCLIVSLDGKILLQKRSSNKKLWPNRWDVTVGGHVRSGELGRYALIRECKEEMGLEIHDDEIKFIVGSIYKKKKNGYINNHFDEFYLVIRNVNLEEIVLQKEETEEAKYFTQDELLDRINNNYDGLTEKTVSWGFIKKIIESQKINTFIKNK